MSSDDDSLPIDTTPCTEVHPLVGLTCYKKGPHFAHFCERDKPDQIFRTYPAKDVWVWWLGAFTKQGRTHSG